VPLTSFEGDAKIAWHPQEIRRESFVVAATSRSSIPKSTETFSTPRKPTRRASSSRFPSTNWMGLRFGRRPSVRVDDYSGVCGKQLDNSAGRMVHSIVPVRTIIGIIALVCVAICGLVATFVHFEIVDLVNAKLPESDQFAWAGWYMGKTLRLWREYKRLYPGGRHILRIHILEAIMLCCLALSAWALRFFAR
jgi:hypothetical protein